LRPSQIKRTSKVVTQCSEESFRVRRLEALESLLNPNAMRDGIYYIAPGLAQTSGNGVVVVENGMMKGFDDQYFYAGHPETEHEWRIVIKYADVNAGSFLRRGTTLKLNETDHGNGFTLEGEIEGWTTIQIAINGTWIGDAVAF
jgi:hypothetical protein